MLTTEISGTPVKDSKDEMAEEPPTEITPFDDAGLVGDEETINNMSDVPEATPQCWRTHRLCSRLWGFSQIHVCVPQVLP